jgi:6-pyruvoyltetrahydropterin/6-carboxytetrahydropterin synthase
MVTLHLYKQNFKFSAAHFLIFDEKSAEKLHGHNYQVRFDMKVESDAKRGYSIDFHALKALFKATLDEWDECVLLPKLNPEMKFEIQGKSMQIHFRDRYYVFPKNEVQLINTTNTSVEELSRLLVEKLANTLQQMGVRSIRIRVEETRGQSAAYQADF